MARVLLVDDEQQFRINLAKRLRMRGYDTVDVASGEEAVKTARADVAIDVVILDRNMPGMMGEQVLKEIKEFRPAMQVIMLTGHATMTSAMETGKLEAYAYLQKPCDIEKLISFVDDARRDRVQVMARHEIPTAAKGSIWKWLAGSHNSRPGIILVGILLFALIVALPPSGRLEELLSAPKTDKIGDINTGYAGYAAMNPGETIASHYSNKNGMDYAVGDVEGRRTLSPQTPAELAFKAHVMLGLLVVAVLFWATSAVPVGITGLMIGGLMCVFGVLKPDAVAQAFAKDSVILVFGSLVLAGAISKTGLDRRIGLWLITPARTLPRLLFLFLPLLALLCTVISGQIMVALLMPLFMMVYVTSTRAEGSKKSRSLAVMLALALCYCVNCGGLGSPAASGQNALMIGFFGDYHMAPSFAEWVQFGMPLVMVMALAIATYFFLAFRREVRSPDLDIPRIARHAASRIGPFSRNELIAAAVLAVVIVLWMSASDIFGMGGPVLLGLVALNLARILKWRDVAAIRWEVVALFAGATAMGKGLADTGAVLYVADLLLGIMPDFVNDGTGLALAFSFFTGLAANVVGDATALSAMGPLAIPMAQVSGTPPLMVGLAAAFSSSFAYMLVAAAPANAIVYAMAKDPVTGEQVVTAADFFKHGAAILLLSFVVLWGWILLDLWRWVGL